MGQKFRPVSEHAHPCLGFTPSARVFVSLVPMTPSKNNQTMFG